MECKYAAETIFGFFMTQILIVENPISTKELKEVAQQVFGDMVKVVVDLRKGVMALGAELHADEEAMLLETGSKQTDLWGFNIYVDQPRDSWLEFNSMINIRPSQKNFARDIQDEEIKLKISEFVEKLVK